MSEKAFRVKASWGDGGASYFYFATEAEARRFQPAKARFNLFTGEQSGVLYPRRTTIQQRGPRGGYSTVSPTRSAIPTLTAAEFTALGNQLYGQHWQAELARVLARDDRTIRRWKSGESPVPEVVARKLRSLAAQSAGSRS